MIESIFYPVGIGKHIVCIDAGLPAAAIQNRLQSNRCCRGKPRTPLFYSGVIRRKRGQN